MSAVLQEKSAQPIILANERFFEAEFQTNRWVANADEATRQPDVLKGEYWAHVANRLKPWDHIYVRAENGTWYTELLVLSVDRAYAAVRPLNQWQFGEDAPTEAQAAAQAAAAYRPKWGGPQHKWCVIRMSDSTKVATELASERAALDWIVEREKAG